MTAPTTRAADPTPFDVCGPLPAGRTTTVLEASAGTGKTFTIAALATRYVAEGAVDLSQLLLATFSRAATQELRERVRERLVSTQQALADPSLARSSDDALVRLLAGVPDEEVRLRHDLLTKALADFDAATIATTHGFCQQMLAGLGVAGDTDPDATFTEDIDDLVAEVVDDLYLRRFAPDPDEPTIDYAEAHVVAREAMADRHAHLVPADADRGSRAQQRYGLAAAVRKEVEARKRTRRLIDYDDLLTRLCRALTDPDTGMTAQQRVRSRYRVVLVDEFQDTDTVQWQILRTAFHGHSTLVLIGDPKQAIYAFRGADLVTYLHAAGEAAEHRTLARNWRSDETMLHALGTVFRGAALGDERITVRPVDAQHSGRRLTGAGAPLRLRVALRSQGHNPRQRLFSVPEARPLVAGDVAADIVRVLGSQATLTLDAEPARPVRPGDFAVLVRTNDDAVRVRDALAAARVPAVLSGTRSVFSARVARHWHTLLRALEQPFRAGLVRAAALTPFLGWTAEQLASAGDEQLDTLGAMLRDWRDLMTSRGVAALLEAVTASQRLVERLLATPTGERDLTDLRHIGEALHAASAEGHLGPAALDEWLGRRIDEAENDVADERSRRLESDADAVQVVTVHGSKGLQFPIVYVPYAWHRWVPNSPETLRLHDEDGTRLLDVGGQTGPGFVDRRRRHEAEESGEDLRLTYVAMTRAQCQVVAWWLPGTYTDCSPLHRLLFAPGAPGQEPPAKVRVPPDDEAWARLQEIAAASSGTISVERVADERDAVWARAAEAEGPLRAAEFDRAVDVSWRRISYTGLTGAVHGPSTAQPGVGSEPEHEERRDEPAVADASPASAAGDTADEGDETLLRAALSPMSDLPSGTAFGTLVHEVFENTDPTAADLGAELRTRCEQAVGRRLSSTVDPGALADALATVVESPLGPLAGGRRLRDVPVADRLTEVEFELPLAGGDEPGGVQATVSGIAALLRRHLDAGDPLGGYADALDIPGLADQPLRGYLTGSIDAVLRVPREGAEHRYLVVDYKTNWLGEADLAADGPLDESTLTAWHYRPSALAHAMVRAHYPLQALLYSVALHRFLRWRHPGYDPSRHLGGVLYLFVRGMCGPSTPVVGDTPCGVFAWQPPPGLLLDVSTLLDGGTP